jgi:hypothetical protein
MSPLRWPGKAPPGGRNPLGSDRALADAWSDETHFLFPDLVCEDAEAERIWPDP